MSLVTDLRRELGLSDRDVMVLRAHLTVLPHGPLQPGKLNVSFMEISEILGRACGMEERRFRRGETKLEKAGLVCRRLSGNGRRFPERDREGRIVNAYGIDLSPLFQRHAELVALRDRIEEEARRLKARKNSVSAYLQSVLKALAAARRALPSRVDELRVRLRNAVRRKTTPLEELDRIEEEISILETAADHLPSGAQDVSDRPAPAHDSAVQPDSHAVDDGQTVRHIESKPKEKDSDRGIAFDPSIVPDAWAKADTLRMYYPDIPRNEREAIRVLFEFSGFLGLGRDVVARALGTFGWEGLVAVLDYLAGKAGQISKPQGYLVSMIKGFESGQSVASGRVRPSRLPRNRVPG